MRRKVIIVLLLSVLLSLMISENMVPTFAEASKNRVEDSSLEVISKNVHKMSNLIFRDKDGLFYIDQKAKDIVGQRAVELYSKDLETVNEAIRTGEMIINKDNTVTTNRIFPKPRTTILWLIINLLKPNKESISYPGFTLIGGGIRYIRIKDGQNEFKQTWEIVAI